MNTSESADPWRVEWYPNTLKTAQTVSNPAMRPTHGQFAQNGETRPGDKAGDHPSSPALGDGGPPPAESRATAEARGGHGPP